MYSAKGRECQRGPCAPCLLELLCCIANSFCCACCEEPQEAAEPNQESEPTAEYEGRWAACTCWNRACLHSVVLRSWELLTFSVLVSGTSTSLCSAGQGDAEPEGGGPAVQADVPDVPAAEEGQMWQLLSASSARRIIAMPAGQNGASPDAESSILQVAAKQRNISLATQVFCTGRQESPLQAGDRDMDRSEIEATGHISDHEP